MDPEVLKGMFPNPDGSGGNADSFANYLKMNAGSVV